VIDGGACVTVSAMHAHDLICALDLDAEVARLAQLRDGKRANT
jgi:hypothetical protein